MNDTVNICSLYRCDSLQQYIGQLVNTYDPIWRQTVTGCKILDILQDMYKFNITYVYGDLQFDSALISGVQNASYDQFDNIDVYARSMSLTLELGDQVHPIHAVNTWRFGYLLRRPDHRFFTQFYSNPFTRPVWNCLYFMAFFTSILFYVLKRWEFSITGGGEPSFPYEVLMVIGAYCQHIPPIDAKLPSRRIAYFIFFVFAYVVYTYYASNLLSNIVNDKHHDIDLDSLIDSYECVIVDYMKTALTESLHHYKENYGTILNMLLELRSVSVPVGLEGVRNNQVALLSDYTTIYPYIRKEFYNDEICRLMSIDLFTSMQNYLFTSNEFRYKEEFKIGTLRIKEAGILKRLLSTDIEAPQCMVSNLVQTCFLQISLLLTILMCIYITCVLILVAERIHFKRNKVWPYVE